MADKIRCLLEDLLPDMLVFVKRKIFDSEEVQQIMLQRENNEYKLLKRNADIHDYMNAINYEYELEKKKSNKFTLLKLRRKNRRDFAIIRRIIQLWDKITYKFKYDIQLWKQYLCLCYYLKSKKQFFKAATNGIRFNPYSLDLWLAAIYYEMEVMHNPFKGRKIFYKAIASNKKNMEFWKEYFSYEIKFLEIVKKREQVLNQQNEEKEKQTEQKIDEEKNFDDINKSDEDENAKNRIEVEKPPVEETAKEQDKDKGQGQGQGQDQGQGQGQGQDQDKAKNQDIGQDKDQNKDKGQDKDQNKDKEKDNDSKSDFSGEAPDFIPFGDNKNEESDNDNNGLLQKLPKNKKEYSQTTNIKVLEIIYEEGIVQFNFLDISTQFMQLLNQFDYEWLSDMRQLIFNKVIDKLKGQNQENMQKEIKIDLLAQFIQKYLKLDYFTSQKPEGITAKSLIESFKKIQEIQLDQQMINQVVLIFLQHISQTKEMQTIFKDSQELQQFVLDICKSMLLQEQKDQLQTKEQIIDLFAQIKKYLSQPSIEFVNKMVTEMNTQKDISIKLLIKGYQILPDEFVRNLINLKIKKINTLNQEDKYMLLEEYLRISNIDLDYLKLYQLGVDNFINCKNLLEKYLTKLFEQVQLKSVTNAYLLFSKIIQQNQNCPLSIYIMYKKFLLKNEDQLKVKSLQIINQMFEKIQIWYKDQLTYWTELMQWLKSTNPQECSQIIDKAMKKSSLCYSDILEKYNQIMNSDIELE